jgi:hypothetical protein
MVSLKKRRGPIVQMRASGVSFHALTKFARVMLNFMYSKL